MTVGNPQVGKVYLWQGMPYLVVEVLSASRQCKLHWARDVDAVAERRWPEDTEVPTQTANFEDLFEVADDGEPTEQEADAWAAAQGYGQPGADFVMDHSGSSAVVVEQSSSSSAMITDD